MIQQKISKVKGIADIVFCIDFSGSMTSCINGVKENINTFVKSLENASPNTKIDWRIAFCAYSNDTFIILDFIKDTNIFSSSLSSVDTMGDEFTPGAIDYSISHFDWRPVSNKFLIVFTDEQLIGGSSYDNGDGSSKFEELLNKIEITKTRLFFFGPKCTYYSRFEKISRTYVEYLESGDFSSVNFSDLLSSLGKTVSQSCGQQAQESSTPAKFIYDLSNFTIKKI